jgi:parallel beta-helix repeat protein
MLRASTVRVHSFHRAMGFLLACLPALVSHATAANDLCGSTIVSNLTLDHDLVCPGDGLVAGADGVEIDLNGHTIAGSGGGVGILVSGRTAVSIVGGTMTNFNTGVRISASTDILVKGNTIRDNTADGIDCQAGCSGNTFKENQFHGNGARGIMLRGDTIGNIIKENTFTGDRVGILLFGARNSIVQENVVASATLAAIRVNVFATGNLLLENTVSESPGGIEFLVAPTGSAVGNTLQENTMSMNACGLKGPTAGNGLSENVFDGNAADVCS